MAATEKSETEIDKEVEKETKGTPASLISELVRFAGRLGEHSIFKESDLGLTEWSFLRMVAAHPGFGGGRIAVRLGITPQRSAQIASVLVASKYLTSSQSSEDARRQVLAITPRGKTKADTIDKQITELFQRAFTDVPRALDSTARNVRRLMKAIAPPAKAK